MAADHNLTDDRRKSLLSDHDIERIGEQFDRKMQGMFEVIGYDTTTPDSRSEIRKDHEFVRDARKAKAIVIIGMLTAFGGSIAAWAVTR